MPHQPASSALQRLTVLDLTHVRAGPVCVRQLADWGANVIRVERPGDPDDFSGRHEPDFQNKHRNKRALAIDLKSPDGVAVFRRMVARADVLVENFRPDVKHRLGIDYETLRAVNPRLVYASVSAFGQDGPYKDIVGVDQIVQGMGGFMSVTGEPGRGPMRAGIALSDLTAGLFAALGILTALYERETSGEGQWVQTSLIQAQLFMLDVHAARYLADGTVPKQVGNQHPTGVPTNAYRTADGFVNIAPTPPMWRRLCRALGREDLIDHPDYATREARRARRKEVDELVQNIVGTMDSATVLAKLQAADVPCGPIYTVDQAFADPQVRHLGVSGTVQHKVLGELTLPRQPFTLSRTPGTFARATPEFAEHTDEILAEFGFTAGEIATFREKGWVE